VVGHIIAIRYIPAMLADVLIHRKVRLIFSWQDNVKVQEARSLHPSKLGKILKSIIGQFHPAQLQYV
jgi:hypothetical protein